jgi:uncharacterized protein YjbI with pentapeptide repeats
VAPETDAPPAADIEERSGEHSGSVPRRVKVLAAVVLAVMLILIVYGYSDMPLSGWIGVANKSFWDYLELLFVPAALALGVYWLNRRQDERDQRIEDDRSRRESKAQTAQVERALEVENERAQDAAMQAYLDQMSQMLTDKDRPLHRAQLHDSLSMVARARTLTVLPRLDSKRKGSVVRFLYEADLINKDRLIVTLDRSRDLRGADLSATYLTNSSLSRADLSEVDLRQTFMPGADLSYANLSGANLSGANLNSVNLSWSVLDGANLSGANLINAVSLADEQIAAAWSLEGATMPDGSMHP